MKKNPRKLEVTVIGNNGKFDTVNFLAGAVRFGERNVASIQDLATQMETMCRNEDRVIALHILDHGNKEGQYVGGDWLDLTTLPEHRANLARLARCFDPGASVTMGGCKVGHAKGLLEELSIVWAGVRVQAGTALQRPLIPGIEGGVTQCILRACSYSGTGLWDRLESE